MALLLFQTSVEILLPDYVNLSPTLNLVCLLMFCPPLQTTPPPLMCRVKSIGVQLVLDRGVCMCAGPGSAGCSVG